MKILEYEHTKVEIALAWEHVHGDVGGGVEGRRATISSLNDEGEGISSRDGAPEVDFTISAIYVKLITTANQMIATSRRKYSRQ